jgi:hypothetical protein
MWFYKPFLKDVQDEWRETDVFEKDVTEQVEGVEVWVGGGS